MFYLTYPHQKYSFCKQKLRIKKINRIFLIQKLTSFSIMDYSQFPRFMYLILHLRNVIINILSTLKYIILRRNRGTSFIDDLLVFKCCITSRLFRLVPDVEKNKGRTDFFKVPWRFLFCNFSIIVLRFFIIHHIFVVAIRDPHTQLRNLLFEFVIFSSCFQCVWDHISF